ncbi:phytanoyl-CoA dioxygenase family protein [Solitalea lacus]|uniref:phytanoyl-CoA dioxygenase family protein n=1 Tax=Solitalea lacus TaxID=2911172 RepID=UPI001EDBA6D8|nr:phytanoyl-CoA dioxygenase family protein [Solitalea lacus]UKJ06774.1 phytanoyl-CoA dioxygenase family protein [Solitalea lacus]
MNKTKAELFRSEDLGVLNTFHLKRFWDKTMKKRAGIIPQDAFLAEWTTDTTLLNILGVGLEQTIIYLYNEAPDFNAFENWILRLNNNALDEEKIKLFNASFFEDKLSESLLTDSILSEDDMLFWERNGYVIVRNAVPKEDCDAVIAALTKFLSIDLNNPITWYNEHSARQGIMVQLFQHPALEKNRNSPKIKAAYEQLWNRTDLWVSTDRVSFNPPENENWKFPGPHLHWDVSLELPIPFGLQGLLYLSDTQADQGAFTLVPGFQHRIESWINSLPFETDPRKEDLHQLGATPITANAGDFIIWHQALPHGSSSNTSHLPRMVQYINYAPIDSEVKTKWK